MAFFGQKKVKNFLTNAIFSKKILLCKILCGGRVAFNKKFVGGKGYFKLLYPKLGQKTGHFLFGENFLLFFSFSVARPKTKPPKTKIPQ
jgi:hypothetical protein